MLGAAPGLCLLSASLLRRMRTACSCATSGFTDLAGGKQVPKVWRYVLCLEEGSQSSPAHPTGTVGLDMAFSLPFSSSWHGNSFILHSPCALCALSAGSQQCKAHIQPFCAGQSSLEHTQHPSHTPSRCLSGAN